jgi:alpha-amylase/alpha-mannosidase (GH57 family)
VSRYLCVHGHFYQPPRENPWTGEIGVEASAAPFRNWNERITEECYRPNAHPVSRAADGTRGEMPSNYSRMSFNFGPTVFEWLDRRAPDVAQEIRRADRESRDRFSGHGSAIAQGYNHMILPLANARDRRTQVLWGIRDFEHRFGRSPEGLWLPETAVDLPTLEVLASLAIRFTILAPQQARRVRPLSGGEWQAVTGGRIDPRRPYAVNLPSGARIAIFFYDGPVSGAIAFGALAEGGEGLARRLAGLAAEAPGPQLLHVATDGETYGHHHNGGEVALAEALDLLPASCFVRLSNYGEFLSLHPPTHEVEIVEDTAWSCAHGLGRWKEDCSCRTGLHPDWVQAWRGPLRDALDALRDGLARVFEERGGAIFADPWAARDASISIVLDPSPEALDDLLGRMGRLPAGAEGTDGEHRARAKALLDMQRHAMLMYTSCGWFFDDPSGLETTQILRYAARAIELCPAPDRAPIEADFLRRLEEIRSNDPEVGTARQIFEANAGPLKVEPNT